MEIFLKKNIKVRDETVLIILVHVCNKNKMNNINKSGIIYTSSK